MKNWHVCLVFDGDSWRDESGMRQRTHQTLIELTCYSTISTFTFFSGTDQQNYLEAVARLFRGITSRPSPACRR